MSGNACLKGNWFRGVIWLALWTLNPMIRVQIPAKPYFKFFLFFFYISYNINMEITDILMAIMVVAYSITIFFQTERGGQAANSGKKITEWGYYWKSEGGDQDRTSWFTKNGKILLSAFLVIIFGLNAFVFKSDWISTILFSMFIIFNYADYFRMEGYSSQCTAVDGTIDDVAKECNFIIPSNKYYAEKYYELRIGYGILILGTGLILAYRDIKSKCDNIINKVVLMTSPLLMMLGLLLISVIFGENDGPLDNSNTNTSFDYIHSYFKGVALPGNGIVGGATVNGDDYTTYITSTYGYNNRGGGGIRQVAGNQGTNGEPSESEKDKISRIQNKIYLKMFLLVSFFGYLWYWALNNDGTCDFDFTSPGKLFSKSPTYMIIFIVLSPFIIKNIMMNECSIESAELTYKHYELDEKTTIFGQDASKPLPCMFDKIGGLGIYLIMCMFCILIYSSSKVGHTLNVPMVTVLLSGILGYMISPSGDLDCSTGAVQSPPPNTGEGPADPTTPTTCAAWTGTCPEPAVASCLGDGVQASNDDCIVSPQGQGSGVDNAACRTGHNAAPFPADAPATTAAEVSQTECEARETPGDCDYIPATEAQACPAADDGQSACIAVDNCRFIAEVVSTTNQQSDNTCNGSTADCQGVCCQ